MKINQDGKEIEVFTAEETEERIKTAQAEAAQKAVDDYKAENPDKAGEIDQLKADLKKVQDELETAEKGGDKSGQVERLRKERDEALGKVTELATTITKRVDELATAGIKETKEELLKRFSNGDAEVKKKIEFEFDKYNPNDNTKQGIQDRMAVAAQIVTGKKPAPSFMDNISGAGERGNGGSHHTQAPDNKPTPNQLAIGRVLGITDEDRANHEKFKASRSNI